MITYPHVFGAPGNGPVCTLDSEPCIRNYHLRLKKPDHLNQPVA